MITDRQKRFVEERLKGKNNAEAARAAGYSESQAMRASTDDILKSKGVREFANQLGYELDKLGVSEESLAIKIKEGLDANALSRQGHEYADMKVRLDYIKYAADLKGLKPVELGDKNNPISITITKYDESEVEDDK